MPKVALCELGDGEIRLAAEDQELGLTLAASEGLSTVRRKVAVVGFGAGPAEQTRSRAASLR